MYTFFFIKLMECISSTKYIDNNKICQKLFSGIIHYTFQNCKECDKKWSDMYFEPMCYLMWSFDSCCLYPFCLLSEAYNEILKITRCFVDFQMNNWKTSSC